MRVMRVDVQSLPVQYTVVYARKEHSFVLYSTELHSVFRTTVFGSFYQKLGDTICNISLNSINRQTGARYGEEIKAKC